MSANSDFIRQIVVTFYATVTRSIACGKYHTLLLLDDVCYSWGRNVHGELGLGNKLRQVTPRVIKLKNIIEMKSGSKHSLALSREKYVYIWGKNSDGQLGLSNYDDKLSPTKIKLENIISACCFGNSTMVLTSDGKVFTWGSNSAGQLGLGNAINHNSPQKLHLKNIVSISVGWYHITATSSPKGWIEEMRKHPGDSSKRKMFGWGRNPLDHLGLGDKSVRRLPTKLNRKNNYPKHYYADHVNKHRLSDVKINVPNENSTIALTKSGDIWSWGSGNHGRLGLGSSKFYRNPQKINLPKVILFDANESNVVSLTLYGEIFVWGDNLAGQLGLGDVGNVFYIPHKLTL